MNEKNINSKSEKEFSVTKLVYLALFLLIVGMVILLGSNTFKSPEVNSSLSAPGEQVNSNEVHGGADLTKLQEIMDIEKQIESNPANSELVLKLGHLLNDSGFYEKAIERYKDYLKKKPKDVDVLVDMGVCYYQLGDFNTAISTMKRAIELDPQHQIGNFNLGIVNLSAGNHDIALEYWKKAAEIDPTTNIGMKAKSLIEQH